MPAKGMTRSTIQCMAVVDAALAQPSGVTVGELCERLECHAKTVRRYLAWMRRTFGVLIKYCGGEGPERRYVYPVGQGRVFTAQAARALERSPSGGVVPASR